jgi:dimethylaniline monooxygenase (N-oxide forming)
MMTEPRLPTRAATRLAHTAQAVVSSAPVSGGSDVTRGVDGLPGLRVCIVGAGMNGLVSTRECLDKGLRPTCFEREDGLGGLWRFTEHESHSSVYRSTHINSPKDWNTFADFPHAANTPRSMPREHVQSYIERYVEEKHLASHIKLSTTVRSITPVAKDPTTGKWSWEVTVERAGDGEMVTEVYDAIIVCTGHHSKPNIPDFPGAEDFKGDIIHSHAYKDNRRFAGKRVVTVGIGNSSSDITTESVCIR